MSTDSAAKRTSAVASATAEPRVLAELTVDAGAHDRRDTLVRFPLDLDASTPLRLHDVEGKTHLLQTHHDGSAAFVLPSLGAGQRASFTIDRENEPRAATLDVIVGDTALDLITNGRAVARFQLRGELPLGVDEVYRRGGYLHPLYTPRGVAVTNDYPEDHRHHHGIWSAWTRTRFRDRPVDFWNMDDRQGKVDFEKLERTFRGPVFAGFEALLSHVASIQNQAVVALRERWTVTTYRRHDSEPSYFVLDIDSTQEAVSDPLLLEEYVYGGFALRGHTQWDDRTRVTFRTSEGLDRERADASKARWCAISGEVDGAAVGFALLGHPENFRAPQPVRIHPKDPYLAFAPVKEGPFSIEPGKPYSSRFRVVSFDGQLDPTLIDRLWQDYADPPAVSVVK